MKNKPLVSVILPIYNVESYLRQCIDSVIRQTYTNLEIILVNDGATDNSGEICAEYAKKDKRIKVVTKKNGGLNLARRDGFLASTGEWITFVDSDDLIDKNYVKYLLDAALKHNTKISICGYQNFTDEFESNKKPARFIPKSSDSMKSIYLLDRSPDKHFFVQTAWGKIIARDIISSVDWDFTNYKTNEDEFMSIFYYSLQKNGAVFVDNQLYFYRQRSDSIMGQNEKEYVNFFEGRQLNRFDFLDAVYNKRLEKFGKKYINEIAFWFTLHFIISTDRQFVNKNIRLGKKDIAMFDEKLPQIKRAIKKYPLYGQHGEIIKAIFAKGSITGFYDYKLNNPLVSVVIPVYNTEKYLYECLESVVNQSYANLEIIVVNDGSTDGSEKIYKKFSESDNRIKVIEKKNGGVSSARNAGLSVANGEYVAFVDADDFLDHNAIKKLVSIGSENNHSIDIIIARLYEYHSDRQVFDFFANSLVKNQVFSYKDGLPETLYSLLTQANSLASKLFKRDLLVKNNLSFPENIKIGEDLVFVAKTYLLSGRLYAIEDNLYYYRNNSSNETSATSNITKEKALDFSNALDSIYNFVKSENIYKSKKLMSGLSSTVIAHCLYNLRLSEKNPSIHREVFNHVAKVTYPKYKIKSEDVLNKSMLSHSLAIEAGDYSAFNIATANSLRDYNEQLIGHNQQLVAQNQQLSESIATLKLSPLGRLKKSARLTPARTKRLLIRVAKKVKRVARKVLR